ncbi:hypothetical protein RIF29_22611 [Crotalaria pallida]|uniref:Uncharacterized protein n=1 Tax=Crotalaria pallida TaxID=3830 RepID=A0AAN9IEL0_CROPI
MFCVIFQAKENMEVGIAYKYTQWHLRCIEALVITSNLWSHSIVQRVFSIYHSLIECTEHNSWSWRSSLICATFFNFLFGLSSHLVHSL